MVGGTTETQQRRTPRHRYRLPLHLTFSSGSSLAFSMSRKFRKIQFYFTVTGVIHVSPRRRSPRTVFFEDRTKQREIFVKAQATAHEYAYGVYVYSVVFNVHDGHDERVHFLSLFYPSMESMLSEYFSAEFGTKKLRMPIF